MKKASISRLSRYQWILVLIVSVATILLLVNVLMGIFYAYSFISHPGAYKYEIAITGLTGFSGNNITQITVPLPVKDDGRSVFREQDIDNRTFGIWTTRLVSAEGGTMVQFSTCEKNLTDIHAVLYREEERDTNRYRELSEEMSPRIPDARTPYSQWIYNQSVQDGPVTLVIIGPGLEKHDESSNLKFDLEFYVGGGTVSSQERDWYRLSILEDIPGSVTGSTPVRIQTGKYVNNRWISFLPMEQKNLPL